MPDTIQFTLTGSLLPEQMLSYIYAPFDVPHGIGRIDVSYTYDSAISSDPTVIGGNTIDIGIFDPRGVQFMTEGFRGWSGSAKSAFFLGLDEATPGYMPGPIQAGTWNLCLGAYKVAPQGCRYEAQITLTSAQQSKESHFPALLRLSHEPILPAPSKKWFKGELHCHSIHSDGDSTPLEIVREAKSLGLDFLAITDHNNQTHLADLAQIETPLILIPGYEVTTYYGHWNIWGEGGWIDFRIQSQEDLHHAMKEAEWRGYMTSCNHPKPYGPEWGFPEYDSYDCIEVWNGPWELFNSHALSYWERHFRVARYSQKHTMVGGSDSHFLKRDHSAHLGHPTTYIYCDAPVSAAALLTSIRAGRTFVSDAPDGPQIYLQSGKALPGDKVGLNFKERLPLYARIINGAGSRLEILGKYGLYISVSVDTDDQDFHWPLNVGWDLEGFLTFFVWAKLVAADGITVRAVCSPIYVSLA